MNKGNIRSLLAPVVVEYKFGEKVFPIRGIVKTVGVNSRGKWFSLLTCKKVVERNSLGIPTEGFIYIEREFSLSNVVRGAEEIAPLYEGLE